jgi:hypothetical protein
MNRHLELLLSDVYDGSLAPTHRADLEQSGLSPETLALQKIRSVPPSMIDSLLGFTTPKVVSAYLLPFPDPHGGFMNFIRMKIFPSVTTATGTIKYLQPRGSGVRIFFPLVTLGSVVCTTEPIYICEGEKKALCLAQLGLAVVGICGIEGWHCARSRVLHPDLDDVPLRGREVNLLPDGDWRTNPAVNRAVQHLAAALEHRGARTNIVIVPHAESAA